MMKRDAMTQPRGRAAAGMAVSSARASGRGKPCYVTAQDGTRLAVQDWGQGRPVLFMAAWALHAAFWGSAMVALAQAGFRAVAYDRRGHGRSDSPSQGYDGDTLAGDLADVIRELRLENAV